MKYHSILCVYDIIYLKCNYTSVLPKKKSEIETDEHLNNNHTDCTVVYQPTCTNFRISITVNLLDHGIFITTLDGHSWLCFTSIIMCGCWSE